MIHNCYSALLESRNLTIILALPLTCEIIKKTLNISEPSFLICKEWIVLKILCFPSIYIYSNSLVTKHPYEQPKNKGTRTHPCVQQFILTDSNFLFITPLPGQFSHSSFLSEAHNLAIFLYLYLS